MTSWGSARVLPADVSVADGGVVGVEALVYGFPAEHWRKLRSTTPLERVNREVGRRTDVAGIFPDDASLIRLSSMLAIEANDEWLVGRAYMSRQSMRGESSAQLKQLSTSPTR